MLCQSVRGASDPSHHDWQRLLHLLCTSHSAPLAPRTFKLLLKTSTTRINTVFPLDHSTFVQSVSLWYKVFPLRPAHVWTQSAAQHFHHLHVNASCGSGSASSHFEWIMLPLHVSCYLWMSRVPLNTSCDLVHVTSECVMLAAVCLTLLRVIHLDMRNRA